MKLVSTKQKNLPNKPILFAVVLVSVVSILGAVTLAPQKSASPSGLVASGNCCLYPMLINVTGVSVGQAYGRYSVVVSLAATNNLGLDLADAGAVVRLKSLTLTLSYQYQSPNGVRTSDEVLVTPNLSLYLTPDQRKAFSVDAGTIQAAAGSAVLVQVAGSYTWNMTVVTSTSRTIFPNGRGLIPAFNTTASLP